MPLDYTARLTLDVPKVLNILLKAQKIICEHIFAKAITLAYLS